MVVVPFAKWRPVPSHSGRMNAHVGLVLHVQVGNNSCYSEFDFPANKASSTWWVAKDGTLEQYVDADDAAWAEAAGNFTYDSVETEGEPNEKLTDAQVDTLARLYAWGHDTYGWPFLPADAPGQRGLGWHGMGGKAWGGHDHCPGDLRKAQRAFILERAQELAGQAATRSAMARFPNAVDACVIPGWLGPMPTGQLGVWVAGSDGGVGAFPNEPGLAVPFHGSVPGNKIALNAPISCIVPHGAGGYWLIGQDGATFNFGDAPFIGWPQSFTYDDALAQYKAGSGAIVNAELFAGGLILVRDDGAYFNLGAPA